ncbi:MAG TPA: hypothetical protein VEB43_02030 [Anaeromyxobacter sp.]|nr:hypothetical protein [Anaeromyxobacter sp.]
MILLLKLLLAPTLVGAASLVARRFGPRAGGLAAALPIVAGPTLLFFTLEQGAAFGAAAARSTLVGLVPLTVFCLAHAHLARAVRLPRRLAAPLCLACGWAAFLAAAALLRPWHVPAWAAPLAGAGALLAGLLLVPEIPADGHAPLRHHPLLELALRMLAAAGLVVGLTALADRLGPTWSGLLTPFPVASSVVVIGTHLADGPEHLAGTLRGFLLGLQGFVSFLTALAFGLVPLGLAPAFGIGLAASLAISALAARRPWAARTAQTLDGPGRSGA